ncbi:transposase [Candidatus Methanocrinis natronophilus]|uniref:Transposase n=1 Tax=Candidatus Methanocrinis natronophilus TaxID=3033396 RepID=A0ABT5X5W9_9EURY|nr:transposase [Candidatus Methanocrinis natronophilus]MDF0590079.1 transposase [Candidatus Methanocrinis natronophilus]
MASLSPIQIYLIGQLLYSVDFLTSQIALIDQQILVLVHRRNEDLKIAISIPGMGLVSASTIIAEIGDFNDFTTGDQLASYCGIEVEDAV